MKYVIEINDHPMNDSCTPALYRAKGFRALVFDQNGLDKLIPFETERAKAWNEGYKVGISVESGREKGYTDGFEDGKEAMKEIVINNLRKILERG